jgi:myo-inositol-1(or 4)-monophosphatase
MAPTADALSDILHAASAIAKGAGEILREGLATVRDQRGAEVQFKTTDIDPVTEYDVRSERYIVGELGRRFPHHRIDGEEGGAYEAESGKTQPQDFNWYIDPLDGTVNFSHGFPYFCVSMGLVVDGVPSLGVVYNPITDELFAAARGLGATCNGAPMRVSTVSELKRALVITGFPYDTHIHDSNMKNFLGFQRTAQATRRIGSAALNLCYTAAGYLDGYWELKTKPHDIAAGIVLVREAGGVVTDFDGGSDMLDVRRIVASNGLIHDQMRAVIKAADDRA